MTPTEPGFYWCKRDKSSEPTMTHVRDLGLNGKYLCVYDVESRIFGGLRIDMFATRHPDAQWSPRIERPE